MKKKTLAAAVLAGAAVVAMPVYRAMFGVEAVNVDATEQAMKIAEYANTDAFITPEALQQLMESDENVVVIGSLNPVRANRPIQGSFTVWRSDYSASGNAYPYGGMRPEQDEMEQLLGSFGATPESTIVVYAADDHHDAARLYWQVKMLGHNDVRYLDGGLNAWSGAGLPTGNANPTVGATDYKAPDYSEAELATFEMVVNATSDSDWVIIDTRGLGEHDGSQTLSGAFGPGAIPSSQFLEWTNALNEDTTLKSAEELKAIYGDLIEGKKVISYCQSGVRSAHTTMVLKEVLGAEEVFNYDGSWIEWSHAYYEAEKEDAAVINAGS